MSTTTLTSKGQITLTKAIRGRLALKREQSPTLDGGYGMLHRLARPKPVSIAAMRDAVSGRAKRKASVEGA